MKKITTIVLPLTLLVVSLFIRVSLMSKGPYHADCLRLALTAEQILEQKKFLFLQPPGHPLTALLGAGFVFFFQAFGGSDSVLAVNFMSVFFSSVSIVLLYFLGKGLFNEKAGWISACLLMCNPIFLATSIYGNSHCLSVFFMLLTFLFLIKTKETGRTRYFLYAILSLGAMGGVRIQEAIFVLFPVVFFLLIEKMGRNKNDSLFMKIRRVAFFLFSVLIIWILLYFPLIAKSSFRTNHALSFVFREIHLPSVFYNFNHFISSVTILGLGLSLWGIMDLYKKNINQSIFLMVWFLPSFLICLVLSFTTPRFFIVSIVPLILLQGKRLADQKKETLFAKGIFFLLFFLVIALSLASVYPLLKVRHEQAYLSSFYVWIGEKTEKNAIIIERDHTLFVQHYAQRQGMSLPQGGETQGQALRMFEQTLEEYLRKGVPVYATGTGIHGFDPHLKYGEFMHARYSLKFVGHRPIESWYRGALVSRIGLIPLYKVEKIK